MSANTRQCKRSSVFNDTPTLCTHKAARLDRKLIRLRLETVIYATQCDDLCSEVRICMRYLIRIEFGFGNPSFVSMWVERPHISRDSKKDGVKVRF